VTEPTDKEKCAFADMYIGGKLGEGVYRTVYALGPEEVVKFESNAGNFCNIKEWELWRQIKDCKRQARWFAPCIHISPSGQALVQVRTEVLTKRFQVERILPKKVPSFLWDLKPENWGVLKGKVVCHDYGNFNFTATDPWRLRKAEWRLND
jgi:hypothetical protein